MLKLFDTSQKGGSLAGEIDDKVFDFSGSDGADNIGPCGAEEEVDDNVEGWINEAELLTDEECAALDMHIQLLRKLLIKVSALKSEIHTIEKQLCRSKSCSLKSSTLALFSCLHGWLC